MSAAEPLRWVVPGEELPAAVAWILGAAGLLCTVAAAARIVDAAERSRGAPAAIPAAPPVALAPVPPPPAPAPPPPAPCAPGFVAPFREGSIHLRVDLSTEVAALRGWLARHPAAHLVVEGHANATGDPGSNLWRSRRRGEAVMERLVGAGIPRSRVTVQAFGSFHPRLGLPEVAGDNRRVVVRVDGMATCPGGGP